MELLCERFSAQLWWHPEMGARVSSMDWYPRAEHLSFCFTQLHFNAEQHKPRNCRTIHQQVCPENHPQSQFVFTNWFAALGWGFLSSTELLLPCAANRDWLLLCHWQRCALGSREPPNQWLLCLSQRQFPQCCNFFHWCYFLETNFVNLEACLCHFCSTEKGSTPHCRFLRHWEVLVPIRPTFSHFPE